MLPSDSAAEEDHRPVSANSDSNSERPTSGVSSRSGAIISNAKSSLREVAEEDQDDNNSTSNENDNNESSQTTMEIKHIFRKSNFCAKFSIYSKIFSISMSH